MGIVVTDEAVRAALDIWYGANHDEPDGPTFRAVIEAALPHLADTGEPLAERPQGASDIPSAFAVRKEALYTAALATIPLDLDDDPDELSQKVMRLHNIAVSFELYLTRPHDEGGND